MICAELNSSSGLFPVDVTGISLRLVDHDLFCWVSTAVQADDRLIALSAEQDEASTQLASILEADHGFAAANATLAAHCLFNEAFRDVASEPKRPPASPVDLLQGWEMPPTPSQFPSQAGL